MRILMSLLLLSVFSSVSFSDEDSPSTIEELKTEEFLIDGSLVERVEREVKRKYIQCMRAFPHKIFCSCLSGKIPLVFNMTQYTLAVTISKEDMGYDKLSKDEKKAVDVTIQARESCADKIKK